MFRSVAITLTLSLVTATAQAALLSRAGGQAYYDDVLNITWLADTNLAASNAFGVAEIEANGTMTWWQATEWIGAMNTAAYLGKSDWRLPTVTDTGTPGCDWAYTGTDCGYNVDLSTSEMANLFYSTLGNTGSRDTSGSLTGCAGAPTYCLTNAGPFTTLQPLSYWSGTEYDAPEPIYAWNFFFHAGSQDYCSKGCLMNAWAVHDGDPFSVVPVPPTVYLFGSALGLMGWMRRKVSG